MNNDEFKVSYVLSFLVVSMLGLRCLIVFCFVPSCFQFYFHSYSIRLYSRYDIILCFSGCG